MIERLSEEIHNIWCKWATSIMQTETISQERADRWKSCMIPYQELSEDMKELDRVVARQLLNILEAK